jgi:hypothetical protein
VRVCDGFESTGDYGGCGSIYISAGGDLWEEVLKIAPDAAVRVSSDECGVSRSVEASIDRRKGGENGTSDTGVAHADVYLAGC